MVFQAAWPLILFYVIFLFFEMCTFYFDDSMPFHNDSLAYVNVLFPLLLRYMFMRIGTDLDLSAAFFACVTSSCLSPQCNLVGF
jgi:hypothetical protein